MPEWKKAKTLRESVDQLLWIGRIGCVIPYRYRRIVVPLETLAAEDGRGIPGDSDSEAVEVTRVTSSTCLSLVISLAYGMNLLSLCMSMKDTVEEARHTNVFLYAVIFRLISANLIGLVLRIGFITRRGRLRTLLRAVDTFEECGLEDLTQSVNASRCSTESEHGKPRSKYFMNRFLAFWCNFGNFLREILTSPTSLVVAVFFSNAIYHFYNDIMGTLQKDQVQTKLERYIFFLPFGDQSPQPGNVTSQGRFAEVSFSILHFIQDLILSFDTAFLLYIMTRLLTHVINALKSVKLITPSIPISATPILSDFCIKLQVLTILTTAINEILSPTLGAIIVLVTVNTTAGLFIWIVFITSTPFHNVSHFCLYMRLLPIVADIAYLLYSLLLASMLPLLTSAIQRSWRIGITDYLKLRAAEPESTPVKEPDSTEFQRAQIVVEGFHLSINASGFFEVTRPFVGTIIGTATTYLIVMVQLR